MMPRRAKELTALEISRLSAPGMYYTGGVPGLALQITDTGARSWLLRYAVGSKRREMGLGRYPGLTLAMARARAMEARELLRQGVDPIEDARAKRGALQSAQAKVVTFERAAALFIEAKGDEWRNPKHRAQWAATLKEYAHPVIGTLLVSDVEQSHVLAVLEPIWRTKTETASRLRGRVESVISYAIQAGYRPQGLNPARWKGNLDMLLAKPSKIAKVEHHAALTYREIGDLMPHLRNVGGMGARALEFAILTAARSGEVRGATWAEIDFEGAVWTVPGERMKAGKEHRIPLSNAALDLLRELPRIATSHFVFPSTKGTPLSDMTLTAVLRRLGVPVTAHGFRSTFRDWAAETTGYPSEVVEMALAHTIGNKVEAAYRRGDLFEKRRRLMDEWAAYCSRGSELTGVVVSFHAVA